MSIYQLKPRFRALLRPLAGSLVRAGYTANQVTLAACLTSVGLGTLLILGRNWTVLFVLLPGWLFLRMAFNAVDGIMARELGQRTALGAYLNELTDVISDAVLYLPFAFLAGSSPWLIGIVIVLAILSEMTGTVAVMTGASRRYDGPMGKSDRAFVFGLLGLLVAAGIDIQAWLNGVWLVLCILLVCTIINRIRCGLAELQRD